MIGIEDARDGSARTGPMDGTTAPAESSPAQQEQHGGPLAGITVISIEQAIAAPLATRHLADLGARVIKIERPGDGDFARDYDGAVRGLSSHFVWTNRSKESVTLDLKHPEASGVLDRLLRTADVVVQNLAPGSVERLGLAPAELHARYPSLVICRISGYGDSGPYASKKAYDLLIQGEAGVLAITGSQDSPAKVGIPVADIAAGMYAFAGILSALFARTRTGEGEIVEVSLLEALAEWMSYPVLFTQYGGTAPARTGMHHATIAPYGPYRASDGELVLLAVQTAAEWKRFCTAVLGRDELTDDPRFSTNEARVANHAALSEALEEGIGPLTSSELIERLNAANIATARLNDVEDLLEHPQLVSRGRWRDVESPVGTIQCILPPINLGSSLPVMGPIPAVGEHTDSVLQGAGLSSSEISSLHDDGVI
jgi:itaconate CoA-transferase